jgi:hypothetical protein
MAGSTEAAASRAQHDVGPVASSYELKNNEIVDVLRVGE